MQIKRRVERSKNVLEQITAGQINIENSHSPTKNVVYWMDLMDVESTGNRKEKRKGGLEKSFQPGSYGLSSHWITRNNNNTFLCNDCRLAVLSKNSQ